MKAFNQAFNQPGGAFRVLLVTFAIVHFVRIFLIPTVAWLIGSEEFADTERVVRIIGFRPSGPCSLPRPVSNCTVNERIHIVLVSAQWDREPFTRDETEVILKSILMSTQCRLFFHFMVSGEAEEWGISDMMEQLGAVPFDAVGPVSPNLVRHDIDALVDQISYDPNHDDKVRAPVPPCVTPAVCRAWRAVADDPPVGYTIHPIPVCWVRHKAELLGINITHHSGEAGFAKLFLPEILWNVRRAIYLDVDMVAAEDLGALWGYFREMDADPDLLLFMGDNHPTAYGPRSRYPFCSCQLIMDLDRLRRHNLTRLVMEAFGEQKAMEVWGFRPGDQWVFTMMCMNNPDKCRTLPKIWNVSGCSKPRFLGLNARDKDQVRCVHAPRTKCAVCMRQGPGALCACAKDQVRCVHAPRTRCAVCMRQGPGALCACAKDQVRCVHAPRTRCAVCMRQGPGALCACAKDQVRCVHAPRTRQNGTCWRMAHFNCIGVRDNRYYALANTDWEDMRQAPYSGARHGSCARLGACTHRPSRCWLSAVRARRSQQQRDMAEWRRAPFQVDARGAADAAQGQKGCVHAASLRAAATGPPPRPPSDQQIAAHWPAVQRPSLAARPHPPCSAPAIAECAPPPFRSFPCGLPPLPQPVRALTCVTHAACPSTSPLARLPSARHLSCRSNHCTSQNHVSHTHPCFSWRFSVVPSPSSSLMCVPVRAAQRPARLSARRPRAGAGERCVGLVGGQLLVKGGAQYEAPDKVGVAGMMAAVQRSGGTQQYPEEHLDDTLEAMAASIETSAGTSSLSASFRCLQEDAPTLLPLLRDVVLAPLLPASKLAFSRTQLLGSIARRNDDPGRVASRELQRLLYSPASPRGRYPLAADVARISLADLRAFHAASYSDPSQAVLGVWGDFDARSMRALLEDTFLAWPAAPATPARRAAKGRAVPYWGPEEGVAASAAGVYVVDRPGLTQSIVRVGELGITISDEDVFALDVLNAILNGFGGRLFDQVRSREGLAYSVSGSWSPGVDHRGAFVGGGETRAEAVGQFVTAVQRVLGEATLLPPSPGELQEAKDRVLNSFVFNFADSGAQLSRIMTYELFGIDQDFIFEFKRRVEALSPEAVLAAAQRRLHPGEQPIVVVADAAAVMPQLSSLGLSVTLIDPV
ncbi:unnamed protein product [Closterium sp. NIES-65]|nr:unnamed protein product [Closterium sp. NIES-65]